MVAYNFPPTPSNGDLYPVSPTAGQSQYQWNAAEGQWKTLGVPNTIAGYVQQTGPNNSAVLPANDTSFRDPSPSPGYLRYNTDINNLEFNDGIGWISAPNLDLRCGGRLTTDAAAVLLPPSMFNVTELFYAPRTSNIITLFEGGRWRPYTFTTITLPLAGLAANTLFDVFAFDSGGTVTLETLAWSNSGAGTSTRATDVILKDGQLVKSTDNRRLIGTFRTTSTIGETSYHFAPGDLVPAEVLVWNAVPEHRVGRLIRKQTSGSSHTYSPGAIAERFYNNDSNNHIKLVNGVALDEQSIASNFNMIFTGTVDAGDTAGVFPKLDGANFFPTSPQVGIITRAGVTHEFKNSTTLFNVSRGYHEVDIFEDVSSAATTFRTYGIQRTVLDLFYYS